MFVRVTDLYCWCAGLAAERREIYSLVEEGLAYLDSRTEFWRQQKPMYARKREKEMKKWHRSPTRPQAPFRTTREVDYTKFAFRALEEIDAGLPACLSICLSVCLPVCLLIYLFVCLSMRVRVELTRGCIGIIAQFGQSLLCTTKKWIQGRILG